MQLVRKLALGVATVSVAFGAGHLVQSGIEDRPQDNKVEAGTGAAQAGDRTTDAPDPASEPLRPVSQAGLGFSDPTVGTVDKIIRPRPRTPEEPSVVAAEVQADLATKPLSAAASEAQPVADTPCAPVLTVTPRDGAMLEVLLMAPCAADARVVLRHAGLALTAHTSTSGMLSLMLPALHSDGQVSATLTDGTTAEGAAPVAMEGLRRFAVQWLSDDAIQLQIYENGAAFGAPGNVSAARPQGAGSLVALGDARADLPLMSEIYTYPASAVPVQVTLEAEVTAANCGRDVLGQTLDSVDGVVKTSDITLTMPGCEATGDILVLNNLVGDTTLAQAE